METQPYNHNHFFEEVLPTLTRAYNLEFHPEKEAVLVEQAREFLIYTSQFFDQILFFDDNPINLGILQWTGGIFTIDEALPLLGDFGKKLHAVDSPVFAKAIEADIHFRSGPTHKEPLRVSRLFSIPELMSINCVLAEIEYNYPAEGRTVTQLRWQIVSPHVLLMAKQ